ncbi:MAG TPA: LLM class flavin-dependent oxidoreductase [Acidimicrobiales bacterium]
MRVGVTLPQFRDDAEAAIAVARRAEAAGLDGVFVFDHMWPLGRPDRPALQSTVLLGALAAETERVTLGTLVARVGMVPDAVLVHQLVTLARIAGPGLRGPNAVNSRFVATVGTGDRKNQPENAAYGVPFGSVQERVAALITVVRGLRAAGVTTWVGGTSRAIVRAATEADGWNGWGISAARLAQYAAEFTALGAPAEITWAGQVLFGEASDARPEVVAGTVAGIARHLEAVAATGATWAICAPIDIGARPEAVELLAEAAEAVR